MKARLPLLIAGLAAWALVSGWSKPPRQQPDQRLLEFAGQVEAALKATAANQKGHQGPR